MANEISFSVSASVTKNNVTSTLSVNGITADLAGNAILVNTQTVGTSEEALVVGDIGAVKYIALYNADATNYVEVDTANPVGTPAALKIPAGKVALLPTEQETWYLKANTAPCDVQVWAVE